VLSKDEYERAKLIRWFGIDKKRTRLENNIQFQGYKYHMNNVNATIGLLQLETVAATVNSYIENGKFFDEALRGINGLELIQYYPGSEPSYWLYTLKVKDRVNFIKMMESNGIAASELHKRNDWHDYLNDFDSPLPVLDNFYSKMVHIPCGWWLNEDIRLKIVSIIKKGW
jgi:dTDP-4-amino-4,6-dideoxygalactose transaminase